MPKTTAVRVTPVATKAPPLSRLRRRLGRGDQKGGGQIALIGVPLAPPPTAAGGLAARYDPARARLSGLGRTRDCTSRTWRIITWGGYQLGVGGTYTLSGPRSFPLVAMARSVR
jgi:hypothetical protein